MNYLEQLLQKEKEQLLCIYKVANQVIENAPPGTLKIIKSGNTNQYYWRKSAADTQGKYISKKDMQFVRNLAQRDYAVKIVSAIQEQIKVIEYMQKRYHANVALSVYEKLLPTKRILVEPYVLPEEEYILRWTRKHLEDRAKGEKLPYQHNQHSIASQRVMEEDSAIITEKGERVRSKSEKILADKLHSKQIPYIYEVPLYLNGYGYIKPDFIVLNRRTRKEYYWEHFGLMERSDYCEKAIKKIELYARNGYYQGNNLILTFETATHPINTRHINALVKEYLM